MLLKLFPIVTLQPYFYGKVLGTTAKIYIFFFTQNITAF